MIAKADTISKSELHKFKIKIMSELVSNGVQIYQFPLDDETVAKVNTTMNVRKCTTTLLGLLMFYVQGVLGSFSQPLRSPVLTKTDVSCLIL